MRTRSLLVCLATALTLAACSSDNNSNDDDQDVAGTDTVGGDTAGGDTGVDPDGAADTADDVPTDTATDTPTDAAPDASTDTGMDADDGGVDGSDDADGGTDVDAADGDAGCPDQDGDTVCDADDLCPGEDDTLDTDADGVPNGCDVCADGPDSDDADLDGVPDACDTCLGGDDALDADGDGVCDALDLCVDGDDALDADGDSIPDACDTCEGGDDVDDADSDGVCDFLDACPDGDDALDDDEDGVADACDVCPDEDDTLDADEDGVPDCADVCADGDDTVDSDGDAVPDACDACEGFDDGDDADGDGIPNACDTCDGDDLTDTDGDGIADACDVCDGFDDADDDDEDGVPDGCDVCPDGDDRVDSDGDGFPNACDLCEGGDDTLDTDADGVADFCDECEGDDLSGDADDDGRCDDIDVCFGDDTTGDTDDDGFCDSDDLCAGDDATGDSDEDGICNDEDTCEGGADDADTDSDGVCDFLDACSGDDASGDTDGDGVCDDEDTCEGGPDSADTDGDGVCDFLDTCLGEDSSGDDDGDGVCNDIDTCDGGDPDADADGDGVCDFNDFCVGLDTAGDTDGDGICDDLDTCAGGDDAADADGDGVCDFLDLCTGSDASGDTDSDGICDDSDTCEGGADDVDADGDGVCDFLDVCTGSDASGDSDSDGICNDSDTCEGGADDVDADGDGVCDFLDACAGSDASGDSDSDGICNDSDTCEGGADDADADGDGICDFLDACTGSDASGDTDGDGTCDDTDTCVGAAGFDDTDGDSICDADDACVNAAGFTDTDGDGTCDADEGATPLSVADMVAGDLVITEIMRNPTAAGDDTGEWFELYNASGEDADLDGLFVTNVAGSESFSVVGELILPADTYAVFADNGDSGVNGGVTVDFEYGAFILSNTADSIILEGTVEIDRVEYSDGDGWPDNGGVSMNFGGDPLADDNNDVSFWCDSSSSFGDGDLGTPGMMNDSCASEPVDSDGDGVPDESDVCPGSDDTIDTDGDGRPDGCDACTGEDTSGDTDSDGLCDDTDPCVNSADDTDTDGDGTCDADETGGPLSVADMVAGDLVISEIMRNPNAVGDGTGEWFEVYNASGEDADLDGLFVSNDTGSESFSVVGELIVAAGEYAVFADNGDPFVNGGFIADFEYGAFILSNTSDTIILEGSVEIDRVDYSDAAGWPDDGGISMTFGGDPLTDDNNDVGFWCNASSTYGDGDLGTPGVMNDSCGSGPVDSDGDGVPDDSDVCPGSDDTVDTDGDGRPDGCDDCTGEDTSGDTDSDGLCDDTDPCVNSADHTDTDGDGTCDADEPPAATPVTDLVAGDLVVTEIMRDSLQVGDNAGEWIELTNTTGSDVDLNGLVVQDAGSDSFTISTELIVAPGGYVVLGINGDPFSNGGYLPDYVYSGMSLSNGDDEVILVGAVELDRVEYSDGAGWPDVAGIAMNFGGNPATEDNNDVVLWCTASDVFGDGDLGTPGAANPSCGTGDADGDGVPDDEDVCNGFDDAADADGDSVPDGCDACDGDDASGDTDGDGTCDDIDACVNAAGFVDTDGDGTCDADEPPTGISLEFLAAGNLVITEFMQNPVAADDSVGEWFEIRNTTPFNVELQGLVISDNGSDSHTVTESTVVSANGYAVLGINGDAGTNGGVDVDYVYSGLSLSNGADEIIISFSTTEFDRVEYDGGPNWPDPTGASSSFGGDPVTDDNSIPSLWCEASSTYGAGDAGTPGAANDSCGAPTDSDGDGVPDGSDVCPGSDDTIDTDGDTVPDGCDTCDGDDAVGDTDGDGLCDDIDPCINSADDTDTDGDGTCDADEGSAALTVNDLFDGQLVITEFMQNPSDGPDEGEWIELLNLAGDSVNLEGLIISDDGSDSHTIVGELVVDDGGYVVLGRNGDTGVNGGVTLDYVYSGIFLGNSDDEIVLSNAFGEIDRVVYDGGPSWPDPLGASSSFGGDAFTDDNNDPAFWCETASTTFGDGDRGTPGFANDVCSDPADDDGDGVPNASDVCPGFDDAVDTDGDGRPDGCDICDGDDGSGDTDADDICDDIDPCVNAADFVDTDGDGTCDADESSAVAVADLVAGDLIITEIMQNPSAVLDGNGEWFEVYNARGEEVDLNGLELRGSTSLDHTVSSSLLVAPGAYVVFGINEDSGTNGGLSVDYEYAGVNLSNGSDTLLLSNGTITIDSVSWDNGSTFPDPNGASMSFGGNLTTDDNAVGTLWCEASSTYGEGDMGTPGAANDPCP